MAPFSKIHNSSSTFFYLTMLNIDMQWHHLEIENILFRITTEYL